MKNFNVNKDGFYGDFGGAFIPEMLFPNIDELQKNYIKISESKEFKKEFNQLLHDYVGRPTPLYYAKRLSEKFKTKIYLKREDLCHTGAHKINNTIGQILLAKKLGKKRIIAETGAGQHGVATATVCALMGVECVIYMGEVDISRQAPNVARMKMLGAKVRPATSGSKTLKDATNEAIRDWISNPVDTHYIIGSVVGSNAAGLFYPFLNNKNVNIVCVEAAGKGVHSGESAATSILGTEGIIHGSKTLLMQTKDGQITEPYSISAGLDYPGIGPMHANLFRSKRGEFISIDDSDAMKWGLILSQMEGIIPAIETSHAFAVLDKMKFNKNDIIVFNCSGRGDKDLDTYVNYFKL